MRRFPWLLLALLLVAPVAFAQPLAPTATVSLAVTQPLPANGTAVVPFTITLDVIGFPCATATDFMVPVNVEQEPVGNESALPVWLHPDPVVFTVPAGQALLGFRHEVAATLVVGPAPPGSTVRLHLVAEAPQGGCDTPVAPTRSGDEATVALTWSVTPPAPPEQSMPGASLLQTLTVFSVCLLGFRQMALNSPGCKG